MCTSIAGCASFGDSQPQTEQGARITLTLENADDTEQRYEVEAVWGGDSRSQFSGTLQAGESDIEMLATTATAPESATFFVGATNDGQRGTWNPTDCRDYHVDAVIGDGTPSFETTCQV